MIIISGQSGINPTANMPLNKGVKILNISTYIPEGYQLIFYRNYDIFYHPTTTASNDSSRVLGYIRTEGDNIELEINTERVLGVFGQIVIPLIPIQ